MHDRPVFKDFDEVHMAQIWKELETRFSFPVKNWKDEFRAFLMKQPRNTPETDAFLIFGNRFINPVLNGILRRNNMFPTFNKLVDYVMRHPHQGVTRPAVPVRGNRKA